MEKEFTERNGWFLVLAATFGVICYWVAQYVNGRTGEPAGLFMLAGITGLAGFISLAIWHVGSGEYKIVGKKYKHTRKEEDEWTEVKECCK